MAVKQFYNCLLYVQKLSRYSEDVKCILIELVDMKNIMCEMRNTCVLTFLEKREISELGDLAKLLSIRKHTENKGFRKLTEHSEL